jgi:hypothetical protein
MNVRSVERTSQKDPFVLQTHALARGVVSEQGNGKNPSGASLCWQKVSHSPLGFCYENSLQHQSCQRDSDHALLCQDAA